MDDFSMIMQIVFHNISAENLTAMIFSLRRLCWTFRREAPRLVIQPTESERVDEWRPNYPDVRHRVENHCGQLFISDISTSKKHRFRWVKLICISAEDSIIIKSLYGSDPFAGTLNNPSYAMRFKMLITCNDHQFIDNGSPRDILRRLEFSPLKHYLCRQIAPTKTIKEFMEGIQ